jgi:hypothetical protein
VKIKMIAAVALVPAAAAGVALSAGTTAKASPPGHSASTSALHSAGVRAHATAAKTHGPARGKADAVHTAAKHTSKHGASARPAAASTAQASAAQADQVQASQQTQSAAPSQQPLNAGESSFEQCVAWRESSDNPTDPDGLFGILPSTWASLGYSGTAGEASVAQQKIAFNRLYAEDGTQPWAPSDGC